MKSQVAAKAVKEMNSHINIKAYSDGVLPETEHIFDDKFFERLDGVVNALDNVKARKFSLILLERIGVLMNVCRSIRRSSLRLLSETIG